jgi:uncharacterized membrane protein YfcA
MVIFLLVLCGLITGLLSGMLGIGGGVITVPALYFLFHYTGAFESHTMQIASSTSLAISLFISFFASIVHYSKRAILFSAFKFLAPGLIIGCISGALLSHFISSDLIRHIFGIGALAIGVYFAVPRLPHFKIASAPNRTLSWFGLMIGTLSSLLGIGGGILAFPTFLGYGLDAKSAAATSSCTTTVSSLIGTITYLLIAWTTPVLPNIFGYVDIHAFLAIGISALFTTPLGVKLAHTFNTRLIKHIFGACLSLIGITMLYPL